MSVLSLTDGVPIAHLIRNGKRVLTIFGKQQREPAIIPPIKGVVKECDIVEQEKKWKLTPKQKGELRKAIDAFTTPSDLLLKKAFESLRRLSIEITKHYIEFDADDGELVPSFGMNEFDAVTLLIGSSGSGKTTLLGNMLKFDDKKRPINLFTRLGKDDPSLKEVQRRITKYNLSLMEEDDLPDREKLAGSVLVFDDIEKTQRLDIFPWLNDLVQTQRHTKTKKGVSLCTIITSHVMPQYRKRVFQDEAKYLIFFPAASPGLALKYLRITMGLRMQDAKEILFRANSHGRWMALFLQKPSSIITLRSVQILG